MNPTQEQVAAIEMAVSGKDCKVTAYAGAGKTSTLKLVGSALGNQSGMYLAFNKAIATEAQSKFEDNVKCKTFHSLAYNSVPRWLTAKLRGDRIMPYDLAAQLNFADCMLPVAAKQQKTIKDLSRNFTAQDQANLVLKAVGMFCRSTDLEIKKYHIQRVLPDWLDESGATEMKNLILPHAQNYWDKITTQGINIKAEHDHYLKHWALSNPEINTDFILFDEAQDADPIMLDVLSKQDAQIIYVGDKHQQIYGFRGAVNAMQSLQIEQTRLSQSFRFGDNIAQVANIILKNVLDETVPLRGFEKIKDSVNEISLLDCDAFLYRTNANALSGLLELHAIGRKPKLEVDTNTLKTQVTDALRLQQGQAAKKGSVFEGFTNWDEVSIYVGDLPQSDITPLVSLINKFEASAILNVLERSTDKNYDCVISTAHKSKGLEFKKVILGGDFFWKKPTKEGEKALSADEARLLYVAATRAQKELDITNLEALFDEITPKNELLAIA